MERYLLYSTVLFIALLNQPAQALVPPLINYQGRVAVDGVNFDGSGQFKFALVDKGVDTSSQATATAVLTANFVTSVTVTDGGAGYATPPAVSFSGGGGSGVAAHALISGGVVTSIVVDNAGSGYSSPPTVTIGSPSASIAHISYWSNDGTSANGAEPTSAVSLGVTKGLYSVLLGDTTLPSMNIVPNSVFNNSEVYLRVWFDDGINGSQLLTPDQRIAAVGYAMVADEAQTVADGAITTAKLANGAVGQAQLAAGAVGQAQLAPGAVADALDADGLGSIPSGSLVLSATENQNLLDAGYVRFGTTHSVAYWENKLPASPPSAREHHSAVWTGTELLIWGGSAGANPVNDGARYDPVANTWTSMSTSGAPAARINHTAIWTGTEMLIWGGDDGVDELSDGARYNAASNTWTPIAAAGAPSARQLHTAVWTGAEMLIWGGFNGGNLNDGARYNPSLNAWTGIATSGAPTARRLHSAVWSGTEMLIWGGLDSGHLGDGARYNAASNSWTSIPAVFDSPLARYGHSVVWTSTKMLIWGGTSSSGYLTHFYCYDPVTESWTQPAASGEPSARVDCPAVWTGTEMLLWGGFDGGYVDDGGLYNSAKDSWTAITSGEPAGRYRHAAVWTGTEMLIWGGQGDNGAGGFTFFNDTWSYTLGKTMFLYQWP